MIGRTLAHYQITSSLGAGGMGEVYRATDTRLGREVALKVLPPTMATNPERLERFRREAMTLASLDHPGVVGVYSVEESDGIHFLTMQLVEGQSLDRLIPEEGLPIDRILSIARALADALATAHGKAVVHRDLKPANVMVAHSGEVKVLDFGLAKVTGPQPETDSNSALPTELRTRDGAVMGTVPYMAPEQVRGDAVDSRTDVFALGIILYELASGQRPFRGATQGALSAAILRDTPPELPTVRGNVPADFARIVARCLEKDPGARFQSALELGHALRQVQLAPEGLGIVKPPPTPATPLLGREESLEAAAGRVRQGEARVLTISGYGGTGKTRFSIELFHRLAPEYPAGAAFVSLASVTAPAGVLPAVAVALDIAEAPGRPALEALCTVIADRPVLLVLDNLEQVLEAAPEIAALVSRCSALQIIATSRAPLKIGAESEFPLPPLALPASADTPLETLGRAPAVALFVQRAEKVKPGFGLNADNASAIVGICRRLDGLPLALELAAARLRVLAPDALLTRLDHALDLLTSGDRDLPLRQRTLRATISWSYSLLEADEQRLLRRTAVFHEGWTFEAMEHVCYEEAERFRALDELDSLVEKGLVRVVDSGERYALLETIRAFATEQLHAGGELDAVRDAHAAYYLDFAARVAADIRGTGQVEAMERARGEHTNTLAAIHWLSKRASGGDQAALEMALQLCGHLNWPWHIAGHHMTGRVLLDALLELARDRPPSRGRALSRLAAGMISTVTGEWERSLAEWAGGHEDGLAVGDPEAAAEGLMGVGYCQIHLGQTEEARQALDQAILASAGGVSDFIHAISLSLMGILLFSTGDLEAGLARVEEAREIQQRLDDCEGGGVALSFLAQMTAAKSGPVEALEVYRDALASFERVGDHPEIARVLCEMGWTALAAEDPATALASFRRAVHAYEAVGSPRGTGLALLGLAAVEAAEGRSERAVAIAAASRALSERAGIVVDHPMDPGVVDRIEALKATIPQAELDGLVAKASALTPAEVLAMLAEEA